MNVQVIIDGKVVLDGEGKVEEEAGGYVELIVSDEEGLQYIVQYQEDNSK